MTETSAEPGRPASSGFAALGARFGEWRKDRRDKPRNKVWRIVRWPIFAGAAMFAMVLLWFGFLYATLDLPETPEPVSSVVLDVNGREVATISGEEYRREVTLDEVSPHVVDALLAAEDRRFYDHGGLDPVGITRAMWTNVRGGEIQGASTITQQLVKNAYLTNERTVDRKVREAILAMKLEQQLSKDEILERYLNTVYFGRGAYGIETAAAVYFDTTAAELDLGQSAMLVGLLQAPEANDPAEHPEAAKQRRAEVLAAMVDEGKVEQADAEAAEESDLGATSKDDPVQLGEGAGAHYVAWVHQQVDEIVGEGAATTRGLTIHTTIDMEDQLIAEAAVGDVLTEPADPEAALVAVDETGAIRAMVGSRDFEQLEVNLALGAAGGGGGRQPGSTFKPFALLAAIEDGTSIKDRFPAPDTITLETDSGPYTVSNYDSGGRGSLDVEQATIGSVNTVYAQIAAKVGAERIVDVAHRAGIESDLEAVPSIVLGTGEVAPIEMADAYSTFARRGEHIEPFAIAKIENASGDVIFEHESERAMVFDPGDVDVVNSVLQKAVEQGTGTAAKLDRPVAGKTGTTQEYGDAWFAGYTPTYTAVVWMGYPDGSAHAMTDVHGRSVTGGSFPAEIWQKFMEGALANVEVAEFTAPDPDRLKGGVDNPLAAEAGQFPAGEDETTTTTEDDEVTATTRPGRKDKDEEPGPSTTSTSTTAPPTTTTAPLPTTSTSAPAAEDDPGPGP